MRHDSRPTFAFRIERGRRPVRPGDRAGLRRRPRLLGREDRSLPVRCRSAGGGVQPRSFPGADQRPAGPPDRPGAGRRGPPCRTIRYSSPLRAVHLLDAGPGCATGELHLSRTQLPRPGPGKPPSALETARAWQSSPPSRTPRRRPSTSAISRFAIPAQRRRQRLGNARPGLL